MGYLFSYGFDFWPDFFRRFGHEMIIDKMKFGSLGFDSDYNFSIFFQWWFGFLTESISNLFQKEKHMILYTVRSVIKFNI